MTFREKWIQDNPGRTFDATCRCPSMFGYEPAGSNCANPETVPEMVRVCKDCWDREIPEEKKETPAYNPVAMAYKLVVDFHYHGKTTDFNQVIRYLGEALDKMGLKPDEKAEDELTNDIPKQWPKANLSLQYEHSKVKDIFEENGGVTVVMEPVSEHAKKLFEEPRILDSGNRTEFATGAVRDMREGKGRCDLMPLEVVADLLPCVNEDFKSGHDPMLHDIASFQKTNDAGWLLAALGNFANYAYNKSPATMFLEVAKQFEEGAKKYGESNWQKGIPAHIYIDSAVRHYLKWLRGDKDEPHDRAFVWNLMCCIWEVDYSPRAEGENVVDEDADKWVRLGDCPIGLFEFSGKIYCKIGSTVIVRVNTGRFESLHPDILVWPIEMEEDGDEVQ